jgi:endonuclease YncB( thermonuclease family)
MPIISARCTELIKKNRPSKNSREKTTGAPKTLWVVLLFVIGLVLVYLTGQGKVIKVYDGASFAIFAGQSNEQVRLYGISCPLRNEPGWQEAKDFTDDMVFLKKLALTPIYINKQGQIVALTQLPNGHLLNEALLRNGYAHVDRASCTEAWCESWMEIEQQAKNMQRGLWRAWAGSTPE